MDCVLLSSQCFLKPLGNHWKHLKGFNAKKEIAKKLGLAISNNLYVQSYMYLGDEPMNSAP